MEKWCGPDPGSPTPKAAVYDEIDHGCPEGHGQLLNVKGYSERNGRYLEQK